MHDKFKNYFKYSPVPQCTMINIGVEIKTNGQHTQFINNNVSPPNVARGGGIVAAVNIKFGISNFE